MRFNNIEMNILVKGKPITEYQHNGQTFVEGRDGSDFEIEIRNTNPFRVEAVVAVDGLSVINGKEAGPQSEGYLLNANETIRIPGWMLNAQQAAAFVFAGNGKKSYADHQAGGKSRNNGVIGIMAFKEKFNSNWAHRPPDPIRLYKDSLNDRLGRQPTSGDYFPSPGVGVMLVDNSYIGGSSDNWFDQEPLQPGQAKGMAAMNATWSAASDQVSASAAAPQTKSRRATRAVTLENTRVEPVQQTLGTGFGSATEFATTQVEFTRGDLHAMAVVYYDDARGLKARGISLDRRSKRRSSQTPVAFPAMTGCVPPEGWNG